MVIVPPILPFARRAKRTAIAPLTLTAATYAVGASVTLSFDRAIDISAFDPSQISVNDASHTHKLWGGTMGTLIDSRTVRVDLSIIITSHGSGIVLSAGPDCGIVAADDGASWSGVDELELPFP